LKTSRRPQTNAPRPDYSVTCGAATIIFEVKELSEDANFQKQPLQISSRTVGEHIRSKIGQSPQADSVRRTAGHSLNLAHL
jgi:hypothetical protein